jgi:hypothetical protein
MMVMAGTTIVVSASLVMFCRKLCNGGPNLDVAISPKTNSKRLIENFISRNIEIN